MRAQEYLALELAIPLSQANEIWHAVGRSIVQALRDFEDVRFIGMFGIVWPPYSTRFQQVKLKVSPQLKQDLLHCLRTYRPHQLRPDGYFAQRNRNLTGMGKSRGRPKGSTRQALYQRAANQ